ncbi:hypothetical protein J6590_006803 [Homalodisca vitripennis]|nr:hypothetical protein J6590_006803 [Homalodisca vitripennis]
MYMSCRLAFRKLKLLTVPCLYILETSMFFKSKCNLIRGSDIHSYETRGRDNYRTGRHRTVVHERLPSQSGAQFVNKLPNFIKSAAMLKAFKTRLKSALLSEAFYNTDEFMAHRFRVNEVIVTYTRKTRCPVKCKDLAFGDARGHGISFGPLSHIIKSPSRLLPSGTATSVKSLVSYEKNKHLRGTEPKPGSRPLSAELWHCHLGLR